MNSQPIPFIPRLSLANAGATVYRRALPGEALVAGRPLRRWFKLWHHRVRDIVFVRAVQLTPSITSYAMLRVLEGGDARFLQALVRHGEGMPTDMQLAMETASTLALLADREVEAFPPLRAPALRMLSRLTLTDLYATDASEASEASEQGDASRGSAVHEEAAWAVAQLQEDDLLAGMQLAELARRELLMLVTRAPKLSRLS